MALWEGEMRRFGIVEGLGLRFNENGRREGITMRLAIKSNRAEGQMQDRWARRKLFALLMG